MESIVRFAAACLVVVSASWADGEPEPAKVTVDELLQTLSLNEARFDEQYTDKMLDVTGEVASIAKHYDGDVITYAVRISGRDTPLVTLYVPAKHRKQLAKYNPGEVITLRGMCRGVAPNGEVQFEDVVPTDK